MKSISRIDQSSKKHHGYYVRVNYRGEQHRKFFSDKKHGGGDEALEAAIKYRNELEKQLGKPRTERMVLARKDGERVGVRRFRHVKKRGDKTYHSDAYEVTWCPEPGKVQRKRFYIGKLGEKEAKRRAYEYRRAQEMKIYGAEIK